MTNSDWLFRNITEYLYECVHNADYKIEEIAEDITHIIHEHNSDYSVYRWHDIQKDPEDLPKVGEMILVESCGIDSTTKKKSYWAFKYRPIDKTWVQSNEAWKYISPFEVEDE